MDSESSSAGAAAVSSAAADTISSGPESAAPSVPAINATNQSPLQTRRFIHSRTGQPMAIEEVYADEDSEDEVDDIADLEDKRRLDEFIDVDQVNKRLMHLWNSFKRKQRVLADGHIPWACEAFSTQHRQELVLNPQLNMCWRIFMGQLIKMGLLDAQTMNKCQSILNNYGDQNSENKN